MNGAQALVRTLTGAGVQVCFSNPGTSEMHFVAALNAVPQMRGVLCLFEGAATGAADGYGRMAGRPAAALLHLGPGLANGLANLHNARRAATPVVTVVGDHATYHKRRMGPWTWSGSWSRRVSCSRFRRRRTGQRSWHGRSASCSISSGPVSRWSGSSRAASRARWCTRACLVRACLVRADPAAAAGQGTAPGRAGGPISGSSSTRTWTWCLRRRISSGPAARGADCTGTGQPGHARGRRSSAAAAPPPRPRPRRPARRWRARRAGRGPADAA